MKKKVLLMLICLLTILPMAAFGIEQELKVDVLRFEYMNFYTDPEGTLWKWGTDYKDGEEVFINKPVKVASDVVSYEDGWILKKDGSLYDGSQLFEVYVKSESGEKTIKVSKMIQNYLLDADNNLYWMDKYNAYQNKTHRVEVKLIKAKIKAVHHFGSILAIFDSNNSLWVWSPTGVDEFGFSANGNLGFESEGDKATLVKIGDDIVKVINAHNAVYAIDSNGDMIGWGKHSLNNSLTPTKMLSNVSDVYASGTSNHIYFKMKNQTLHEYAGTYNDTTGRLNYKLEKIHTNMERPISFYFLSESDDLVYYNPSTETYEPFMSDVKTLYDADFMLYDNEPMGAFKSIIIKNDDSLWTAGSNFNGLLGTGNTSENDDISLEIATKVMSDVKEFYSNDRTTYVLKKDGSLWGWGRNSEGQLADGTFENRFEPVKIFDAPSTSKLTPIRIFIDDAPLDLENQPVVVSGRTLVPMAEIFKALGATVEWIPETNTVKATRETTEVSFVIGSTKALINGNEVTMDVPSQIIDRRTFVPLKFISEALGETVEWKSDTRSIFIKKN